MVRKSSKAKWGGGFEMAVSGITHEVTREIWTTLLDEGRSRLYAASCVYTFSHLDVQRLAVKEDAATSYKPPPRSSASDAKAGISLIHSRFVQLVEITNILTLDIGLFPDNILASLQQAQKPSQAKARSNAGEVRSGQRLSVNFRGIQTGLFVKLFRLLHFVEHDIVSDFSAFHRNQWITEIPNRNSLILAG